MKRLLAYLFLVLGLGLVFSVNANAGLKIVGQRIDLSFCKKESGSIVYPVLTEKFSRHCTYENGIKANYQDWKRINKIYTKLKFAMQNSDLDEYTFSHYQESANQIYSAYKAQTVLN